jgi:hypothetical protein
MKNGCIFYDHKFAAIRYISWSFGIVCGDMVYLYQEKSGNPGQELCM